MRESIPFGSEASMAVRQVFRERCRCGREVSIYFNGEGLCPACYGEKMSVLAESH